MRARHAAKVASTGFSQWESLPSEMLAHSVRFMPVLTIGTIPRVCRSWWVAMGSDIHTYIHADVVDALIKEACMQRFPYLAKLLARFPEEPASQNFRAIYQEQVRAERPPVRAEAKYETLAEYMVTVLIKHPGGTTIEWSGTATDALAGFDLWEDAPPPAWFYHPGDLTLDVLVSKLTTRGIGTTTLCRGIWVHETGIQPNGHAEDTPHAGHAEHVLFLAHLPTNESAERWMDGMGYQRPPFLLAPWIECSSGRVASMFRWDTDDDVPLGTEMTEEQLLFCMQQLPWEQFPGKLFSLGTVPREVVAYRIEAALRSSHPQRGAKHAQSHWDNDFRT